MIIQIIKAKLKLYMCYFCGAIFDHDKEGIVWHITGNAYCEKCRVFSKRLEN